MWQYSEKDAKLVWQGDAKSMISDMHATNDGLFVVRSNSNQEMEGGFLDVNNGQFNIIHTQRLALRQYPLSKESILVGRVYGDKPRSDGDLFYSNTKIKIPTKRGVRAIGVADINQDQKGTYSYLTGGIFNMEPMHKHVLFFMRDQILQNAG